MPNFRNWRWVVPAGMLTVLLALGPPTWSSEPDEFTPLTCEIAGMVDRFAAHMVAETGLPEDQSAAMVGWINEWIVQGSCDA